MRRMVAAFNDLDDDGRQTAAMLNVQHAFEMLLKAGCSTKVKVFDKDTGPIGFEKCLHLLLFQIPHRQVSLIGSFDECCSVHLTARQPGDQITLCLVCTGN